jgi:hypothetical protein
MRVTLTVGTIAPTRCHDEFGAVVAEEAKLVNECSCIKSVHAVVVNGTILHPPTDIGLGVESDGRA